MSVFTEDFRRQHQEILALVSEITSMISPSYTPGASEKIRTLLSNLAGKISVHRAAEDNFLYPKLFVHESEEMRVLSKRYQEEILSRKEATAAYFNNWRIAEDIREKADEFNKATQAIFTGIRMRIDKEDNELFALADKLIK